MFVLATKEKMLYCPKCEQVYEDGTQRFCSNDGGRLLPAPSSPNEQSKPKGVFSSLIAKTEPPKFDKEKLNSIPRYSDLKAENFQSFQLPIESKNFKAEDDLDLDFDLELELEPKKDKPSENIQTIDISSTLPEKFGARVEEVYEPNFDPELEPEFDAIIEPKIDRELEPVNESDFESKFDSSFEAIKHPTFQFPPEPVYQPEIETESIYEQKYEPTNDFELELETFTPIESPVKPFTRTVNIEDVPSGQAELGDRKINPTGRLALTLDNPNILLGQTIKGRYYIIEFRGKEELSFNYLAEDKLLQSKKVFVRVFMDEESGDDFIKTIYAEERISLSHLNHPNIAKVIDSGELLEGKPFIILEHSQAESVRHFLQKSGQFNTLRTARIIRQAAYALSEAHQNGILHRNLKPESILLGINEKGAEQVKVANFGVSSSKLNQESLIYKAPEILEGKLATFAGDIYSLAVIAYEMLTNRLPFNGGNEREILKAQREGLMLHPTNFRLDLPGSIDGILEKAMSYKATERYPKARDFGDAFYSALTKTLTQEEEKHVKKEIIEIFPINTDAKIENTEYQSKAEDVIPMPAMPIVFAKASEEAKIGTESPISEDLPIMSDIHINSQTDEETEVEVSKKENFLSEDEKNADPAWTKRSPEPPKNSAANFVLFGLLGIGLILAGFAAWYFLVNRQPQSEVATQNTSANGIQSTMTPVEAVTPQNSPTNPVESEVPPLARQISQPPNTQYFQNSKQNAKGDLLSNFLGFSVYYPKDWQVNDTLPAEKSKGRGKFLDVSKKTANGAPIEQMLVSYYSSKGNYKEDLANFPILVKETNDTLKKILPNYQLLSEGETKVNGWKAYEVKFQGGGENEKGEKIILWGRRLFIPAARAGIKNGYEITMFATSYSPDVKSVDDVGIKGELATILETFEPDSN